MPERSGFADVDRLKAELLRRRLAAAGLGGAAAVGGASPAAETRLSFGQQRLWFLDRFSPGLALYNIPAAVRLRGPVDVRILERAFGEVVERHEALRTVFEDVEGQPRSRIVPHAAFRVAFEDLQHVSPAEREDEAVRRATRFAAVPFDLAQGPLLRVSVFRLSPLDHLLAIVVHHMVADGASMEILIREITAACVDLANGRRPALAPLARQYSAYVARQREQFESGLLAPHVDFWREALAGMADSLELPTDFPRGAGRHQGSKLEHPLDRSLIPRIASLAARHGTTAFTVLLCAFQILVARYTGRSDIVVGTPVNNRPGIDFEPLIGFFVNTLVLRTALASNLSFDEALSRTGRTVADAMSHQDVPFEWLVQELNPRRVLSQTPLIQLMFSFQRESRAGTNGSALGFEPVSIQLPFAKFDLSLYVVERGRRLTATFEYDTGLFSADTIARLGRHYETLLKAVTADPAISLGAIPLADREDAVLRGPRRPLPAGSECSIPALFARQAARTPSAIAVVDDEGPLTYAELYRRVRAAADSLSRLGATPGSVVAVALNRSSRLIIGVLAALEAGAAYLPLDPQQPEARLAAMIEAATPGLCLSDDGRVITAATPVVRFDQLDLASTPTRSWPANDTAYVIFTSGSTGSPKGVEVTRESVVNVLLSIADAIGAGPGDRVLSVTTPGFDIAALEWFLPLVTGATLVIATTEEARDGHALARRLSEDRITVLQATPATWRLLVNAGWTGAPALRALCGGEALPIDLARQLAERTAALWNVYGPTETTIWSMIWAVTPDATRVVLGAPVANTHVTLVGGDGALVPAGAEGEIVIGGAGVARGYLDAPALTAERFVPDTFAQTPGARAYRTGDRARRLADGSLEFLGRADRQLKVRGHRVEPSEIETALAACRGVGDCAVVPHTASSGDIRLVAFVVPIGDEPTADELRAGLRRRLPDYLIPSDFSIVGSLPLTPSGKVDRRALEARRVISPVSREAVVPIDPREELLLAVYADVLQRDDVGPDDNFFDIGGHSLLAACAIARAQSLFGTEVPLRTIFESPSARALARRIAALDGSGASERIPVRAAGAPPATALSFAQERLYFLSRLEGGRGAYNLVFGARVRGRLDADLLHRCLQDIVRRHEVFRTAFVDVGGVPHAIVQNEAPIPLAMSDASALDRAGLSAHVEAIARDLAARPFDLAAPPLARATLVNAHDDSSVLVLSLHHLVADGPSIELVTRELWELYRAAAAQQTLTLPPPAVQYSDYAAWQRAALTPPVVETRLAFWREHVGSASTSVDFVTDRRRPRTPSSDGAHLGVRLSTDIAGRVRDMARRQHATLFMTLLASWEAYVSRWAAIDDFLVGTPVGNRPRPELEGAVGMFANTIVVRADLRGDPSFVQLVDRVRRAQLDVLAHQDLPFEMLVDALTPARDVDRTPLFQTMFTLQHVRRKDGPDQPGWEPLRLETGVARYDVSLAITDVEGELAAEFEFRSDLFDADTMEAVAGQWRALLEAALRDPDLPVSRLRLPAARAIGAAPDSAWQPVSALRRVEAAASATPDAPALVTDAEALTYRELVGRVHRGEAALRQAGVRSGDYVPIEVRRDADTIALMLAVLRVGAAYVPVAADAPAERTRAIVGAVGGASPWRGASLGPAAVQQSAVHDVTFHAQAPAYVIFTSGSTGSPNGVVVPQGALAHYVDAAIHRFGIRATDRVLQCAPLTFDASVEEIFPTLASGATLILASEQALASAEDFVAFCTRHDLTVIDLPTAFWHELADAMKKGAPRLPPTVRLAIIGGEEARADLVAAWHALMPDVALVNTYGPTETTVVATACTLRPDLRSDADGRRVPLGSGLPRVRVDLLDRHLDAVAVGMPGELCIGGAGVASGYIGDPRLTAERFVPDPFAARPGARMFRTGDLARITPAGEVEFLGRQDRQIKVRGYRVEPAEVEAVLAGHPAVAQCAVVGDHAPGDGGRLVACVVRQPGHDAPAGVLRAYLQERLPSYLVPSAIGFGPRIPRTPSGKIDREAIVATARATGSVEPFAAPDPIVDLLTAIWSDVLGAQAGPDDSFFDLGGHSLLVLRLVSALREALAAAVPVRAIFDAPTPAALAAWLRRRSATPASASIPPTGRVTAPLTAAQARVWETQQRLPGSSQFNVNVAVRLDADLDPQILADALHDVSTRHAVLTSRVLADPGLPPGLVPSASALDVDFFDLTSLAAEDADATARDLGEYLRRLPFELTDEAPVRVWLARLAAGSSILLASMHHIVADAVSVDIFLNELADRYRARALGHASEPPPLRPTFMDYAMWERETLANGGFAADLAFWRDVLAPPLDRLQLPGARSLPGGTADGFDVARERLVLPPSIVDPMFAAARRRRATPFMATLAAISAAIARLSGAADVRLATMSANRAAPGTADLIGLLANTIVLRTRTADDPPFDELLARVRTAVLNAFEHQALPFDVLLTSLEADGLSDRPAVAPVLVLWEYDRAAAADEWGARPLYPPEETPRAGTVATAFDIVWECHAGGSGLELTLMYRTARYDRSAIRPLLDAFEHFVREECGGRDRA